MRDLGDGDDGGAGEYCAAGRTHGGAAFASERGQKLSEFSGQRSAAAAGASETTRGAAPAGLAIATVDTRTISVHRGDLCAWHRQRKLRRVRRSCRRRLGAHRIVRLGEVGHSAADLGVAWRSVQQGVIGLRHAMRDTEGARS